MALILLNQNCKLNDGLSHFVIKMNNDSTAFNVLKWGCFA